MRIREAQARVRAFAEMANRAGAEQTIGDTPAVRDGEFRAGLIEEEAVRELCSALRDGDLVKAADGMADTLFVVFGAAVACGIELEPIFEEVCRSNETKEGGPVVGGKLLKPDHFSPADVEGELRRQGWEPR